MNKTSLVTFSALPFCGNALIPLNCYITHRSIPKLMPPTVKVSFVEGFFVPFCRCTTTDSWNRAAAFLLYPFSYHVLIGEVPTSFLFSISTTHFKPSLQHMFTFPTTEHFTFDYLLHFAQLHSRRLLDKIIQLFLTSFPPKVTVAEEKWVEILNRILKGTTLIKNHRKL